MKSHPLKSGDVLVFTVARAGKYDPLPERSRTLGLVPEGLTLQRAAELAAKGFDREIEQALIEDAEQRLEDMKTERDRHLEAAGDLETEIDELADRLGNGKVDNEA